MSKSSHHSFYFNEDSRGVLDALYDFSRCQRADGSYYGTAGQCRIGKEVGAKEISMLKAATKAGNKKAKLALDVVEGRKTKAQARKEIKGMGAVESPTPAKDPKAEYASLMKRQQEMVSKGDMKGAMELVPKLKALTDKLKADEANDPVTQAQSKGQKYAAEIDQKKDELKRRKTVYDGGQNNANLDQKQRSALRDYTEEDGKRPYSALNACLRLPKTCDPENQEWTKQHAKELDSALKALPNNEAGEPFWRGIRASWTGPTAALYEALENAQPGQKITDPAFGSYSYDESVAKGFTSRGGPSIVFVNRSKELRPINEYSAISTELEALLPRGAELTIRSVTKDGQMLIVELD